MNHSVTDAHAEPEAGVSISFYAHMKKHVDGATLRAIEAFYDNKPSVEGSDQDSGDLSDDFADGVVISSKGTGSGTPHRTPQKKRKTDKRGLSPDASQRLREQIVTRAAETPPAKVVAPPELGSGTVSLC